LIRSRSSDEDPLGTYRLITEMSSKSARSTRPSSLQWSNVVPTT
jgi:hypothetical protein